MPDKEDLSLSAADLEAVRDLIPEFDCGWDDKGELHFTPKNQAARDYVERKNGK